MELLDRYLNAIRFLLPRAQQDDIVAELREDLCQQIEDRESHLGRKLTDDELAAILKQRGQPMLVAARYAPQQTLIGPVLLPIYTFVLRLAVLWIMLPIFTLIVGPVVVFTSTNATAGLLKALWGLVTGTVFATGLITIIFAILERFPDQLNKWDPRKLPSSMPNLPDFANLGTAYLPKPTPRWKAITEIVSAIIGAQAWSYVIWFHPNLVFGTDAVQATLGPIWRTMYWPILAVFLAGVALGIFTLIWPAETRIRSMIRIGIVTLSLTIACVLLSGNNWIELTSRTVPPASLAEASKWTNIGVQIGIAAAAVVNLIEIGMEAFRLFRSRSIRASHLAA